MQLKPHVSETMRAVLQDALKPPVNAGMAAIVLPADYQRNYEKAQLKNWIDDDGKLTKTGLKLCALLDIK